MITGVCVRETGEREREIVIMGSLILDSKGKW